MRQFSCAYGPFGILLPWTCGGNTTRKFTGDPNREADLKPALFYEARTLSLMLQAWGGGGCTEEPSGALGPDFCLELPHFMSSKRDAKIVVAHMRLACERPRGKHARKPAISQRRSTAMHPTLACGAAHVCILVGMTKRDKENFRFTSAPEGIPRQDCVSKRSALPPCSCRRPEEASDGNFGNGFLLLLNIYSFIDMSSNLS